MSERIGVSLGVDVGKARVGLAASDPDGIMAQPVKTLSRDVKKMSDIRVIVKAAEERSARRIFVGLPLSLSGGETSSTQDARDYADELASAVAQSGAECEVFLVDERLTTVTAHQKLREAGVNSREHRKIVDQVAAVAILDHALDQLRGRGSAGVAVSATPAPSPRQEGEETEG